MAGRYVTKAHHESLMNAWAAKNNQLKRAADRMAAGIVVAMFATRELDQRSAAADAVLDYKDDPPMTLAEAREILKGYE